MTTKSNIALAELVEKGADADLLREMIQYVAQRMADGRLRQPRFQAFDRRRLLARSIGSFELRIRIAARTSLVDRALLSADHDAGLSA